MYKYYDFYCEACGEKREEMTDSEKEEVYICDRCGKPMERMIAVPFINLVTYIDGRTKRFQKLKEDFAIKKAKLTEKEEKK